MSFDFEAIDFDKAEQETNYAPIPSGKYYALIESAEIKTFGKSEHLTLHIQYCILDGDYTDRRVSSFFALTGDDPQKVAMSHGSIARLAKAIDEDNGTKLLSKNGESFFVDKVLVIEVTVYQPQDTSKQPKNNVWKGYNKSTYDKSKTPKRSGATYSNAVLNATPSDNDLPF